MEQYVMKPLDFTILRRFIHQRAYTKNVTIYNIYLIICTCCMDTSHTHTQMKRCDDIDWVDFEEPPHTCIERYITFAGETNAQFNGIQWASFYTGFHDEFFPSSFVSSLYESACEFVSPGVLMLSWIVDVTTKMAMALDNFKWICRNYLDILIISFKLWKNGRLFGCDYFKFIVKFVVFHPFSSKLKQNSEKQSSKSFVHDSEVTNTRNNMNRTMILYLKVDWKYYIVNFIFRLWSGHREGAGALSYIHVVTDHLLDKVTHISYIKLESATIFDMNFRLQAMQSNKFVIKIDGNRPICGHSLCIS